MNFKWRWLKRRKLRVDIVTIFAVLVTFISLSIIGYTYVKTSKLILDLGSNIIEKSIESVISKFNDYVSPSAFFDMSSAFLNNGWLDNENKDTLVDFMQVLLMTHPQLTSAYIADEYDNMFIQSRVYREPKTEMATLFLAFTDIPSETQSVSEIITRKNNKTFLRAIFKNAEGNIVGEITHRVIHFIPHNQAWFQGALKSSSHNWVIVDNYNDSSGVQMTISEAIKFHGKDMGVIGVDVNIDAVTGYLEEYRVSKHSETFVVDHANNVIAKVAQTKAKDTLLPRVEDLDNQRLTMAYHIFKSTGKRNFTFNLAGMDYIIKVAPYALIKDVGWEIITIVPVDDFIGETKENYRDILLFSFLMLFTGLLLVLIFSHKISRPIMKLAKETKQINNLDFERASIIKTHIYEIQILTDAFNAAKKALFSFSKYIPKALLAKLVHAGTIASVGGERKEMSVLFSDIRNFATVAEKISPEELMVHISEYLNIITQIIHRYHGNVDKFIGDAVMAFWGAPLDDLNHVSHACLAALSCRYHIGKLNESWKKQGKPLFYTRFGINTGVAVVGNMGSFDRLNYTAIGDEVNLAARLEQINKLYGTQIIVSEAVYLVCQNEFVFRPVDRVRLKGKSKETAIYELLAVNEGPQEIVVSEAQKELSQLTAMAYEAFHAEKIDLAKSLFQSILIKYPEDPVAVFYLKKMGGDES